MAVAKVRNLWTAFITAFFAVLATLGLTGTATAAAAGALQQPADQPAERTTERAAPVAPVPAPRTDTGRRTARLADAEERGLAPHPAPRDRSLPPTIKQRISAEAHGSSPSVRRIPAELPFEDLLVASDADQAVTTGAAAGRTASAGLRGAGAATAALSAAA